MFNTEIIEDDIDALGDNPVLLSPALMRKLVPCSAAYTFTFVRVEGGNRNVPAVMSEILGADPKLGVGPIGGGIGRTSGEVAKAERAITPESIALGVFGAMTTLARVAHRRPVDRT